MSENVLVSYFETANTIEIVLQYIELSENATSIDIMFMRCCRDIALLSRITSLCQTNFLPPKYCKCLCDALMQCVFNKCKHDF